MICRVCQTDTFVVDSRTVDGPGVRRRRECAGCKRRFTTYEVELGRELAAFIQSGGNPAIQLVRPADRGAVFAVETDACGLVSLQRIEDAVAVLPYEPAAVECVVQLFHAITGWLLRLEAHHGIEATS